MKMKRRNQMNLVRSVNLELMCIKFKSIKIVFFDSYLHSFVNSK